MLEGFYIYYTMNNCKPFKELIPADTCVICGMSQAKAGNMIVSQNARGLGFSDTPIGGGGKKKQYRSLPLNNDRTEFTVFWGEVEFWSQTSMQKAVEVYHQNKHPWFCSYCGKRTCSNCGEPLVSPLGSDFFNIKGELLHAPILMMKIRCINLLCEKY